MISGERKLCKRFGLNVIVSVVVFVCVCMCVSVCVYSYGWMVVCECYSITVCLSLCVSVCMGWLSVIVYKSYRLLDFEDGNF